MRIEVCWYCSSNIYPGHGVAFVRNDGKMFRFCRSKCHKHFKMKHNPRKSRWTKAYRKSAGKEMVTDSTFEFEKRRNRPVRYNRELMVKTIQAMKTIDRIKQLRKERFHKQRLAATRSIRMGMAKSEIAKSIHLLAQTDSLRTTQTPEAREERRQKTMALIAEKNAALRKKKDNMMSDE